MTVLIVAGLLLAIGLATFVATRISRIVAAYRDGRGRRRRRR